MTPDQLKKQLEQGQTQSLYLFYGEEEYLIRLYIQKIKTLLLGEHPAAEFNFMTFDHADPQVLEQALSTPPVFAEKKMIWITNSGLFQKPREDMKSFWEKTFSELPPDICLVFAETAVDKRQKKLLQLVEQHGCCVKCTYLNEAQLKAWLTILLREQGHKMAERDLAYLISCCGHGMTALQKEVDKVCHYADQEVITRAQLDAVVTKTVENRIFELSDAVLQRQTERAWVILGDLKTLRESPIKISSILSKAFCDIYKVKHSPGATPQSAGLHPYVWKLHRASAGKIGDQRLQYLIDEAVKLDLALKQSSKEDWVLLEQYIAKASILGGGK